MEKFFDQLVYVIDNGQFWQMPRLTAYANGYADADIVGIVMTTSYSTSDWNDYPSSPNAYGGGSNSFDDFFKGMKSIVIDSNPDLPTPVFEEWDDEPNPKNKVYGPLKARQNVIPKRMTIPSKPKFNQSIRASMRSVNRNR